MRCLCFAATGAVLVRVLTVVMSLSGLLLPVLRTKQQAPGAAAARVEIRRSIGV